MFAKLATYHEVCEHWSLKELLDAHEILDQQEAEQRRQLAEMQRAREPPHRGR